MDRAIFIQLANELRATLTELHTAGTSSAEIDEQMLEWLATKCDAGYRLPMLVELYHTTMKAMVLTIEQLEEKNEDSTVPESD